MPHLFKTQKQIQARELPEPQEKLLILNHSIELLLEAGYVYIGMDHFAKPDDELAIAQDREDLHRNFQGYSTHKDCDLFSFGVSSISMIGDAIFQNTKSVNDYAADIKEKRLPLLRGLQLTFDDKVRQLVISKLMCNFKLHYSEVEAIFNIKFQRYFNDELARLRPLARDGLIALDTQSISVRPKGRLLVRRICMEFDTYIDRSNTENSQKYSRII